MKYIFVVSVAIIGSCASAASQSMYVCQTVRKPSERLACIDKLSPPITGKQSKQNDNTGTTDSFALEEARMKKLLSPICKNC